MYAKGDGAAKDSVEAVKWYRKSADQGTADAQLNLGVMYANGEGVVKDSAEAVNWYRKAADQGNASGQVILGAMYSKGEGVPKDSAEAVKWYRKAADQWQAFAQYFLGRMYDKGEGVADWVGGVEPRSGEGWSGRPDVRRVCVGWRLRLSARCRAGPFCSEVHLCYTPQPGR